MEVPLEVALEDNSFGVEVEAKVVVVENISDSLVEELVGKKEVVAVMEVGVFPIHHWQVLAVVLTMRHQAQ